MRGIALALFEADATEDEEVVVPSAGDSKLAGSEGRPSEGPGRSTVTELCEHQVADGFGRLRRLQSAIDHQELVDDRSAGEGRWLPEGGEGRPLERFAVPLELRDLIGVMLRVPATCDEHGALVLGGDAVGEGLWEDALEVQPLGCRRGQDEGVGIPDLGVAVPGAASGEVGAASDDEGVIGDADEGARTADGVGERGELGPLEERSVSGGAETSEGGEEEGDQHPKG